MLITANPAYCSMLVWSLSLWTDFCVGSVFLNLSACWLIFLWGVSLRFTQWDVLNSAVNFLHFKITTQAAMTQATPLKILKAASTQNAHVNVRVCFCVCVHVCVCACQRRWGGEGEGREKERWQMWPCQWLHLARFKTTRTDKEIWEAQGRMCLDVSDNKMAASKVELYYHYLHL